MVLMIYGVPCYLDVELLTFSGFHYLEANDLAMSNAIDRELLQQWLLQKMDPAAITDSLTAQGLDESAISDHLRAYRKLRNEKKQFIGFIVTGAGALLGFISCVLSLVNPIPELYNFILFGVTSVAILLIVAGMYLVFE